MYTRCLQGSNVLLVNVRYLCNVFIAGWPRCWCVQLAWIITHSFESRKSSFLSVSLALSRFLITSDHTVFSFLLVESYCAGKFANWWSQDALSRTQLAAPQVRITAISELEMTKAVWKFAEPLHELQQSSLRMQCSIEFMQILRSITGCMQRLPEQQSSQLWLFVTENVHTIASSHHPRESRTRSAVSHYITMPPSDRLEATLVTLKNFMHLP